MIANTNSIVQHVTQIKNRIGKHVIMNIKIIVSIKKNIFRILAHVFVRTVPISKSPVMFQKLCGMKLYLLWILYQQK